jgi:PIN domain nuclease of toxin-antitoxin system
MIRVVADTHALVWALYQDARLSPAARVAFAPADGDTVGLSTISLVEVLYLEEKARLPAGTLARVKAALADSSWALEEIPVSAHIVDAMARISREAVPDMPDRLIAGTALHVGVPLITRDGKIRAANLATIW